MRRKVKLARIVWISSAFILLIVILVMVMDYKIHYQYKNLGKIYFYDCDGVLCVTEVKNDNYLLYNTYECGYDDCPVLKAELNDTYVVLNSNDKSILFDYRKGQVISDLYDNYQLFNNKYFVVLKKNNYGIIDSSNNLIKSLVYDGFGYIKDGSFVGYNSKTIIALKNDKYGIVSIDKNDIVEDFIHDESDIDYLLKLILEQEFKEQKS